MFFNNETQSFMFYDGYWHGHWYEDEDKNLYIVTPDELIDEYYGPDNGIMQQICLHNHLHNVYKLSDEEMERLFGLIRIPHALKRFNKKDGYYHS